MWFLKARKYLKLTIEVNMEENMSKIINLFAILLLSLMVMFAVSCEGPAGTDGLAGADGTDGAAGADGADGMDGNVTCIGCHSEANMIDNQIEMSRSQHGIGEWINYADYYGGGCARCHSGNGFIEFVTTGEVADNVKVPEAWDCGTCHGLHTTFEEADYALRLTDASPAMFDATVSLDVDENSNLCVSCHQARRGPAQYWDGVADSVSLAAAQHPGPHHGPQSNVLLGNLGASSTGAPFAAHVGAGCVGCHMTEGTGDDANVAGGHTFKPLVEGCANTGCHTSATDFDLFGGQTSVTTKMEALNGHLLTAGILDSTGHLHDGTYSAEVFQAWWNYVVVHEDRSLGVHNPTYTHALLDEAIDLVD